jgi:hypothetical protein
MPRVGGRHIEGKRDANQSPVIGWYQQLGCSVVDLGDVGRGCPDLLIGCAGEDGLAEVKVEGEELRPSQVTFNDKWRGRRPWKVSTMNDVIEHVAFLRKRARRP